MKEFFAKYKSEIGIGVLTSILATIVIELIRNTIEAMPGAGYSVLTAWINNIFRLAASMTQYTFALCACMAVIMGTFIGACVVVKGKIKNIISRNRLIKHIGLLEKDKLSKIDNLTSKESNSNEHSPLSEIKSIRQEAKKGRKRNACILVIFVGWTIVCEVLLFSILLCPIILNDAFVRTTAIIRPYITEQQYIQIQSEWRSMKNKDDFDAINEFITDIRNENQLW